MLAEWEFGWGLTGRILERGMAGWGEVLSLAATGSCICFT